MKNNDVTLSEKVMDWLMVITVGCMTMLVVTMGIGILIMMIKKMLGY